MQLSPNQESTINTLLPLIEYLWGTKIGYFGPFGAFLSADDIFVLYDNRNPQAVYAFSTGDGPEPVHDCHLIHHSDLQTEQGSAPFQVTTNKGTVNKSIPCLVRADKPEHCLHDDLVQEFLDKIDNALLEGELYFPPVYETEYVGYPLTVKQIDPETFSVFMHFGAYQSSFNVKYANLLSDKKYSHRDIKRVDLKAIIDREFIVNMGL